MGPAIHDFRALFAPIPGWDISQAQEWRDSDIDSAYSLVVELLLPSGETVNAFFRSAAYGTSPDPSRVVFYGKKGALTLATGHDGVLVQHYDGARGTWEDMPPSDELAKAVPTVEDTVQRSWNMFFQAFVADLRGQPGAYYPTFHDGWVMAAITEAAWAGRGWSELPQPTSARVAAR